MKKRAVDGLAWALFVRSREFLAIGREELEDLEEIRERVWMGEKKRYSLWNPIR